MVCKKKSYPNQSIAEIEAENASKCYEKEMVAYRCKKCRRWHLSPADRNTPSKYCQTCGKKSYQTKADAKRRAEIIYREEHKKLNVYECPWGGWHLTSQDL